MAAAKKKYGITWTDVKNMVATRAKLIAGIQADIAQFEITPQELFGGTPVALRSKATRKAAKKKAAPKKRVRRVFTDEQKAVIMKKAEALLKAGKTKAVTAEKLGIGENLLYRWLAEAKSTPAAKKAA